MGSRIGLLGIGGSLLGGIALLAVRRLIPRVGIGLPLGIGRLRLLGDRLHPPGKAEMLVGEIPDQRKIEVLMGQGHEAQDQQQHRLQEAGQTKQDASGSERNES